MAETNDGGGVLHKIASRLWKKQNDKGEQVPLDDYSMGYDGATVAMLLGSAYDPARTRAEIYEKWHYMAGTAIISAALRLHVTAALGGHETSGDVVFIETVGDAEKDGGPGRSEVDELIADLSPIFNRIAYTMAFRGTVFGDAYARVYTEKGAGITNLYTDELVYPPLIQPYEQGGLTRGYVIANGERNLERLTILQMARLKLPRMLWSPQVRVMDKARVTDLTKDNFDDMPLVAASAGGSFLDGSEAAFDNFMKSLTGLLGQRVMDSIDESMVGVNMEGMTKDQRLKYMNSLKRILSESKVRAEAAVKKNEPVLQRFFHILPTFGEKQLVNLQPAGSGKQGNITIEDVLFHAKVLSGSLGIDLSMLGFSEMLSGGLGDGGFFRVSAQSAERSRMIRVGLTEFFNDLIDLHTNAKWGWVFDDKKRPYKINFYGSISALETEKQRTRENQMNAGLSLITALGQLKDASLGQKSNLYVLSKVMGLDEEDAEVIAGEVAKAAAEAKKEAAAGGFGGDPAMNEEGSVVAPKMESEEE